MIKSNRIYFVDFARSFAIVLALTDHSMNEFNVWTQYSPALFSIVKTLTTSATPTFLLLFGMMLEIIYLKKFRKKGIRSVASQLVHRSFQCYVGYFLTVLAGFIGGVLTFKRSLAAYLFLGNSHFGNILKLYTVVLVVAIPLVWFRDRYGIRKTVLLGLAPWMLYPLFQFIPPLQDNIAIFTSSFFGFGGKGGPSVLNSISLVVVGMLSASFISMEDPKKFIKGTIKILGVLGFLLLFVFFLFPTHELVHNHLRNYYRVMNSPVYYIFSAILGLLVAVGSALLIPIGQKVNLAVSTFLAFGRSSLTAFTAGNIILNLVASIAVMYVWSSMAPLSFVVIVFLILIFYERIYPTLDLSRKINESSRGLSIRYRWFYVRRISNFSAQYLK